MADIRATPAPQLRGNQRPVQDKVVARPQQAGFAPPAAEASGAELEGLLRGLQSFNQNLGNYTDYSIGAERARLTEVVKNESAAVAAKTDLTSMTPEEARAQDLPANVPVAYGKMFRDNLGAMLVDRSAVKAQQDWLAEYQAEKDKPEFNPEQFMQGFRTKALAGLSDPSMTGRMGAKLTEMESGLRSMMEKDRVAKLQSEVHSGVAASFEHNFRADMTHDQLAGQYFNMLPQWRALGKTPKELSSMLFDRVSYISDQLNGNKDVFKVFDAVDPQTKQSLLTLNPELAPKVIAARHTAEQQNLQHLTKAAEQYNFAVTDTINQMIEKVPNEVTYEVVMNNFGPTKAYKTHDEAAAVLVRARKAAEEKGVMANVMADMDLGTLGRYEPDIQNKAWEARYGHVFTGLWKDAVEGKEGAVAAVGKLLVDANNKAGSTVPLKPLSRLIEMTTQQLPGDKPTAAFKAMAALYEHLSTAPEFRDRHFKENESQVLDQYLAAKGNAMDEESAYKAAVQSTSPEAREAAKKITGTQEFKDKVRSVHKEVTGRSWVPFMGNVGNTEYVANEAAAAAAAWLQRNPGMGAAEAVAYSKKWTARNMVLDRETGMAIKVPEGHTDGITSEAFSEFSKRAAEKLRLNDLNGADWKIHFVPVGNKGDYEVRAFDGLANRAVADVSLDQIIRAYRNERNLTPEDRTVLGTITQQYQQGALDPAFVAEHSAVLTKARVTGELRPELAKAIDRARLDTALNNVRSFSNLNMGNPTMEDLATVPQRGTKVDNKLTAQMARSLATAGVPGMGSSAASLAASLITVGEGVLTRAAVDPNPKAGMNIGTGYNLNANVKTVREDLKRSGVPEDRIDAVIKGEAQMTPEQVQRLTMVAVPRFERRARNAAEETAKGLWGRMSDAQRAVMIDVAWQVGDPSKFKQAWAAVASGDMAKFREETKVFYTNAAGERTEDKRRSDLRAAMLNGNAQWLTVVDKYGSFPSNALEAVALNKPKK